MSVQLIAWAYEQQTGSPTEKAVLLALANAANHHTGLCCPRIERLAQETELGESTVRKALASLVDKNIIAKHRPRRPDGTKGTNNYSFPHLLAESTPPLPDSASPALPRSALVEPEEVLEPEEPFAAAPRVEIVADSGEPGLGEYKVVWEAEAKPTRQRNPVWDALGEIFGEPTTRSAQKVRGKVCSSLTAARASPDEITARAKRWPLHFDGATLTDLALEKHWDTLGRQPLRRQA